MVYKVDYIFKVDKKGRKYALKINLKTNKKQRINYKHAKKLEANLIYQRKKVKPVKIFKKTKKEYTGQYKIDYIFKVDKIGRKYALKINLKTNKKQRIKYKYAEKLKLSLVRGRKKAKIVKDIKETKSGATYNEYIKQYEIVEKEIVEKREKEHKKPLEPSKLRVQVKQKTIHERTGIATRYRFMWIYKIKIKYVNEITGEIFYECASPEFTTSAHNMNGNEFKNMKEVCIDAYKYIKGNSLCSLDGGACVILYNKADKFIIEQYELGKGCGFAFNFKDDNDNIIYRLKDGYICTE